MTTTGRDLGLLLLFVVAALLAYRPVLESGGFVWDDDDYVTENRLLEEEGGLRRIWLEPSASPQYYPLVFTSFLVERRLFGAGPFAHHLTNVLLHALTAFLAFLVARRLGLRFALLGALLFLLHPVQVESVAWITERKNVLSGALGLGALLLWLRSEGGPAFGRWWFAALGLFVLALLAKTVVATLAPSLLVIVWWRRGRIGRRDLLRALPFVVVGLAFGLVTAALEVSSVRASGADWDLGPADRVLVAGRAVLFYAGKLLWPAPLVFSYERWEIAASRPLQWLPPLAVLGLAIALLVLRRRGRIGRGPFAALALYVGNLFPALGFVNVYPMRYSFVADHFQYLASLAVLLPLAALAARRVPRAALVAIGLLVLVVLGAMSSARSRVYENAEVLWRATLADNPDSWLAANYLGALALERGRFDEARRLTERALAINPRAHEVLNNAGKIAADVDGDQELAIALFRRALEEDPLCTAARTNLALLLVRTGRAEEALAECDRALAEAPERERLRVQARWIRARALHELGRNEEALAEIEPVLRALGPHPEALDLRGRIEAALR